QVVACGNHEARKVPSHVGLRGFRRNQSGVGTHTRIGVALRTHQAGEHRPEAAEIPSDTPVRSVAAAKQLTRVRRPGKLIGNDVVFDVSVSPGTPYEPDILSSET